jgi:class 3 adenylate cyclase/tetratricopeptide (TPR) repeat protein
MPCESSQEGKKIDTSYKTDSTDHCLGYLSRLIRRQAFPARRREKLAVIKGTFLFADLSGFTSISDKLSETGRQGAEELASVINSIFDPLLEIMDMYGGDVVKFGGDSTLVLFERRNHTKRAIACAEALLERTGSSYRISTSVGVFPVQIHIGISRGKALSLIAGKRGGRYDHLFCGPDLSLAYAAADVAGAGEICVAERNLEIAGDRVSVGPRGVFKIISADESSICPLPKGIVQDKLRVSQARSFIIPELWDRIVDSGNRKIDGEHRHVSSMFIGIEGWYNMLSRHSERRGGVISKVNNHVTSLFEIAERYGGNIVRLDIDDHGERALVLFGAPKLRESAPGDAIRAALEMRDLTAELSANLPWPVNIRFGINSGVSYVGDVGGSYRREYTAMGKEVNLAARLMSVAERGEILVGPATLEAMAGEFLVESRGQLNVKGIAQPVNVSSVVARSGVKGSKKPGTVLYGREIEISAIDDYVAKTKRGESRLMLITGEAGSGKSVLLEYASSRFDESKIRVLKSNCFEHMSNTPLFPVADIMKQAVDIIPEDTRDVKRRKLVAVLERIKATEWEGLICQHAGYHVRPSPAISNLTESAKRQKTFQMVMAVISSCRFDQPAVLVIDDLHWGDATTLEFIDKCVARLVGDRISVMLVTRDSERVCRHKDAILIGLGALDDKAGGSLLRSVAREELPDRFLQRVLKVTGGNPFFLEEIAKAINDMGADRWVSSTAIPGSVERVITARIDCLDEMVKTTIRTASVIGRNFRLDDLEGIFPVAEKAACLPGYLEKSASLDITPMRRAEPVMEYGFKHILTRDVAYGGLSFKSRKVLHLALADFYRINRSERGADAGIIGYHYERSDSPKKAVPYYLLAGNEAGRAFSNAEAIHFYARILELLQSEGNLHIRCRALLGLGRVYRLIGDYEKSETNFRDVLRVSPSDHRWKAEALKGLSELYRIRSEFDKASRTLSELVDVDPANPLHKAVFENGMGEIARRSGRPEQALDYYRRAFDYMKSAEDDLAAQVHNNMGICLWTLGRLDAALERYGRAAAIYEKDHNLQGKAKISNNSGIILEQKGDLATAAESYRSAEDIFRKIGDTRSRGFCLGNLATNYITRGLPHRAKKYIALALELFEQIGDRDSYALTVGNLADWYYQTGDVESAVSHYERTINLAKQLGNDELVCETNIRMARIMLSRQPSQAQITLRKAYSESVERKWRDLELKAEYLQLEWRILNDLEIDLQSLLREAEELRTKGPGPDQLCAIDILMGILHHRKGDIETARLALIRAYRKACMSDLVLDRWLILSLYGLVGPVSRKGVKRRIEILEARIFENLDKETVDNMKKRFENLVKGYLRNFNTKSEKPLHTLFSR